MVAALVWTAAIAGPFMLLMRGNAQVSRFGGDPRVVGRTVRLNSGAFEIVGVAPRGFRGTGLTNDPDLFLPITAAGLLGVGPAAREDIFEDRGSRWIDALVGRLRPGAGVAALQEEMGALAHHLNELHPDIKVKIAETVLTWSGWDSPLDLHARNVQVQDAEGNGLAVLPNIAV